MNALVSIIMPSYNSEKFIAKAIESVLSQTYSNWELIIIDDCSDDSSINIIQSKAQKEQRIKIIKQKSNAGAAVARNSGIKAAKGEYIAFLDSDDLWVEDKLEKQVKYMQINKCAFSCSNYYKIGEDGKLIGHSAIKKKRLSYTDLLKRNYIGCLTAMYDVKKIGKVYSPIIRKRNDYALWLNITKKGINAYCLEDNLAYYRIRTESISSNKFDLIKYNYELFRKIEKMSILKSAFFLSCNIMNKVFSK